MYFVNAVTFAWYRGTSQIEEAASVYRLTSVHVITIIMKNIMLIIIMMIEDVSEFHPYIRSAIRA